jgi:glycine/D-amino acid oxidase-like deaminating enzyme
MSTEIGARAAVADEARWRRRSLWLDTLGEPLVPRPALEGSVDCDVAVVGGGLVGLWTAYSLVRADASLRVVLVEAEIAGYASAGRTTGFVSAGIAGEARVYREREGDAGVIRAAGDDRRRRRGQGRLAAGGDQSPATRADPRGAGGAAGARDR